MPEDLFVTHGLHGLHEWPDAQDAVLTLLTAHRQDAEKSEREVGRVIASAESEKSRISRDS